MAQAQGVPPAVSDPGAPGRGGPAIPRSWGLAAFLVLILFVAQQSHALWREWQRLHDELVHARQTGVIGFTNISPRVSYAERPADWFHTEGDSTYLWGGWDPRIGHRWFRIGRGELEAWTISQPTGRDVHQAIDEPLFEVEGGAIWSRIPADAAVVGIDVAGVASSYPVLVLDKVKVVNDQIYERPILVTYNGFAPPEGSVRVYEAVLDGARVTMGSSGYFQAGTPLLYDRGSESLWRVDRDALRAIAGPHRGRTIPEVAQPIPVAWSDWRGSHRGGRLLVGADRSHPRDGSVGMPWKWEGR
jgi:hypothetical protein